MKNNINYVEEIKKLNTRMDIKKIEIHQKQQYIEAI